MQRLNLKEFKRIYTRVLLAKIKILTRKLLL